MGIVRWKGHLYPREFLEPPLDTPPGVCWVCGGLGLVAQPIDEEQFDAMVPCHACQIFCHSCDRFVKREGHVHDRQ